MELTKLKIAVFVSGRGSNLKAILDDTSLEKLVDVSLIVSNKIECPAFGQGAEKNIKCISVGEKQGYTNYKDLLSLINKEDIKLIVLAGYLKLIPDFFIKEFTGKIINIHPALLPSFGGAGMYGMNVHKAVFESSVTFSGPTVHFVDENYDEGKIILQRCVNISDARSPEEIAEKVLKEEHILLPFIIKKFAENKIKIFNNRVYIES